LVEQDYPENTSEYVDFPSFYECVAYAINKIVKENPEEKGLLDLLGKLKVSLDI